jgi:hypothetical protein
MKIAFIESECHQKTQSSLFFKEILSKKYELVILLDNSQNTSNLLKIEEINKQNFDVIIFWQFIKEPSYVNRINCKNIIWIPMYDAEIVRKFKKIRLPLYASLNLKIISFSKALTDLFHKNKFANILNVQYSPENNTKKSLSTCKDGLNIIFWQRTQIINWPIIKKIIGHSKINKIIIKTNLDDGHNRHSSPTKEEIKKYNIEFNDDWLDDKQYIELLKQNDLFFEPRKYEGIGMGFLDAMSYGIPVVSPDKPTMNEYIKDKYNGYLYDITNPKSIDFSEINNIKNNLNNYLSENHKKWLMDQENIINFIENEDIIIHKLNEVYFIYSILLDNIILLKRKFFNLLKKLSV